MKEELITFFVASLPVLEVRGAIPLAMGVFEFSFLKAYVISVIGNISLIAPALFFLQKFSDYLAHRWYFYNRLITWVFDRTQKKHLDHFHEKKWVGFALFAFVAVPLPLTGAWSGLIVAYLLGIPFWKTIAIIFLGILAAGAVVGIFFSTGLIAVKSIPF